MSPNVYSTNRPRGLANIGLLAWCILLIATPICWAVIYLLYRMVWYALFNAGWL